MKTINEMYRHKYLLYIVLASILAGCLWIGWHDFDPRMPQEAVRENIRSGIRGIIQLAVQYFIPINILIYFVQEIVAKRRNNLVESVVD